MLVQPPLPYYAKFRVLFGAALQQLGSARHTAADWVQPIGRSALTGSIRIARSFRISPGF
jgi:hypothetical protein